jgi:hypothetical protein
LRLGYIRLNTMTQRICVVVLMLSSASIFSPKDKGSSSYKYTRCYSPEYHIDVFTAVRISGLIRGPNIVYWKPLTGRYKA